MKGTLWPRLSFFCILNQQSPLYYKKLQTTGSFLVNTAVFHHNISAYSAEDFPGGSVLSVKYFYLLCRNHKPHMFNPWVGKIPWRREWQFIQFSCLGNTMHAQRRVQATVYGVARVRHDSGQTTTTAKCDGLWGPTLISFSSLLPLTFFCRISFHQVLMTWIWVTFIILWVSKGQGLFLNYL